MEAAEMVEVADIQWWLEATEHDVRSKTENSTVITPLPHDEIWMLGEKTISDVNMSARRKAKQIQPVEYNVLQMRQQVEVEMEAASLSEETMGKSVKK